MTNTGRRKRHLKNVEDRGREKAEKDKMKKKYSKEKQQRRQKKALRIQGKEGRQSKSTTT